MKGALSFTVGVRVQVFSASHKLVGKTGIVSFFLPGEQVTSISRVIPKKLIAVNMDDTGELEQFFFEELAKI